MTAALILAAGESRRMGFPKALLRYREEQFVDRLVGLLGARCNPVVVVLGAGAEEIRSAATRPTTFVVNHDYPSGQTSSLQCGLRVLPPDVDGVLFTLVDHPAVSPATINALLAAHVLPAAGALLAAGGAPAADAPFGASALPAPDAPPAAHALPATQSSTLLRVPRHQGRRGHPIWFSRDLFPEFLALPVTGAARDVVRAHTAQTQFLDVDDPGILADIDDPAAYRNLLEAVR